MSDDARPSHRARRRILSPDEARIWKAVVSDVAPLPGKRVDLDDIPPPAVEAAPPPAPASLPAKAAARPPAPRAPLPDLGHGQTPGLDRRSSERMKRGEMAIEASLDLHGMDQDRAHGALNAFIARAYDSGRRCVLVVTGKGKMGGGILRAQVPRWLNQSPLRERILGFSHARPQHGAEGALYILIKRRRA